MFDKDTLIIAQAKEMAIMDGLSWNFIGQDKKDAYLEKADAFLVRLFHPGMVEEAPAEELVYVVPVCPECGGLGFTEKEHGLIQVACSLCHPPFEVDIIETVTVTEGAEPEAELKPGQYMCSKCGQAHKATSSIGKKHLKYKG